MNTSRALRIVPTSDLSSAERSERVDLMIDQLAAVTRQVNVLTSDAVALRTQQGATAATLAALRARPFLARLRWLVTGR